MKLAPLFCTLGLFFAAGVAAASTTEKPEYTLAIEVAPNPAKADAPTTYRLKIAPKGDYTFKSDTPFKLKLAAGEGVTLDKHAFKNTDLKDAESGMKIETAFTAKSGEHEIQADVTFFLCTEEMCKRFKEKAALKVAAK